MAICPLRRFPEQDFLALFINKNLNHLTLFKGEGFLMNTAFLFSMLKSLNILKNLIFLSFDTASLVYSQNSNKI
jgi:hypothetical protein